MTDLAPALHPRIREVTERIRARSSDSRSDYLQRMAAARSDGPQRGLHGCTNLAHGLRPLARTSRH